MIEPHSHSAGARASRRYYLALMIVVGPSLYFAYLGKLFSPEINHYYFRDFGVLVVFANEYVFGSGKWPIGIDYYPPTNAIFMNILSYIGSENAFRLHLTIQALSYIAAVVAWVHIIRLQCRRDIAGILILSVLASLFYVAFELQMHNVNMLTLALVSVSLWLRDRPCLAGALFAAAAAIKPYGSLLMVLWMIWNREWRWSIASAFWLIVILVVLPVLVFGVAHSVELYDGWLTSVFMTMKLEWIHEYGFSLRGGIAELLSVAVTSAQVDFITRTFEFLWIGSLTLFFVPTLRRTCMSGGLTMTAEISALLIAFLPLGGLQQIARSAVFLVPAIVLSSAILDNKALLHVRAFSMLTLAAMAIAPRVVPIGQLQCVVTAGLCMLVLAALALVRWQQAEPVKPVS